MLSLETPRTGLIDGEAKIAWGLARVLLECLEEPQQMTMIPQPDHYRLEVEGTVSPQDFRHAFLTWCIRVLSSEPKMRDTPGAPLKYFEDYCQRLRDFPQYFSELDIMGFYLPPRPLPIEKKSFHKVNRCHHNNESFDQMKGCKLKRVILFSSAHIGKPYKRNRAGAASNIRLCPLCNALSLIGARTAQKSIRLGNRGIVAITPLIISSITGDDYIKLISAINYLEEWINEIPINSVMLVLLARAPHLAEVSSGINLTLHLALIEAQKRVSSTSLIPLKPLADYISHKSFNTYIASRAYSRHARTDLRTLLYLSDLLLSRDYARQRWLAYAFARQYIVNENSQKGEVCNYIYPQTTNYILKEVLKMPPELITDQHLRSATNMLRYFVRERKFGYVDNIRNARTPQEFKKEFLLALREARSIFEGSKPGEARPHIPSERDIEHILKLIEEHLEEVKTVMALFALSFPARKEA